MLSCLEDIIKDVVMTRQDWGVGEEEHAAVMTVGDGGVGGGDGGGGGSSPDQPADADESDLEEGEIPDEAGNCDNLIGETMSAPDVNKPACPMAVGGGHGEDPRHTSRQERTVNVWRRLCSAWVLRSCDDVRCQHAHGYVPRMCPGRHPPGDFCAISAYGVCPYAHSAEELLGMQACGAVTRHIDRVLVAPTLCADHLASGGCSRGDDACPFAHSTEELLLALQGAAYRNVRREVCLQIETRDINHVIEQRRSVLCQNWLRGRLVSLKVWSRIALSSRKALRLRE